MVAGGELQLVCARLKAVTPIYLEIAHDAEQSHGATSLRSSGRSISLDILFRTLRQGR